MSTSAASATEVAITNSYRKLTSGTRGPLEFQMEAGKRILSTGNRLTFVSAPCGEGKSMIFQTALDALKSIKLTKAIETVTLIIEPTRVLCSSQIATLAQLVLLLEVRQAHQPRHPWREEDRL